MTAPTIPGDHLTSADAGSPDSSVGTQRASRTRAVVQVDRQGQLLTMLTATLISSLLTSAPRGIASSHSLIIKLRQRLSNELIGNDRIGRLGDMPGTEEAIRAFFLGKSAPKPKLTLIQREDEQ